MTTCPNPHCGETKRIDHGYAMWLGEGTLAHCRVCGRTWTLRGTWREQGKDGHKDGAG